MRSWAMLTIGWVLLIVGFAAMIFLMPPMIMLPLLLPFPGGVLALAIIAVLCFPAGAITVLISTLDPPKRPTHCPRCRYNLRYLAGCPECGWNRSASDASA